MAAKTKHNSKAGSKTTGKASAKASPAHKSLISKVKPVKSAARKPAKPVSNRVMAGAKKTTHAVEVRSPSKPKEIQPKASALQKVKVRDSASAIQAYEAGLKLMHAEEHERAIKTFRELIAGHPEEPEIQERARVLMHASEKRVVEKARTVLKSADDHYNMGIAELNRRQLDAAAQHLQHALKLVPKGDHILYAMAAVNALKGNRDEALSFLKQSIHHRPENRFMAARDSDFETLIEDADFKQLVTPPEK